MERQRLLSAYPSHLFFPPTYSGTLHRSYSFAFYDYHNHCFLSYFFAFTPLAFYSYCF